MNEPLKCRKCGKHKPETDFHRRAISKNGRETICKACINPIKKAIEHRRVFSGKCHPAVNKFLMGA